MVQHVSTGNYPLVRSASDAMTDLLAGTGGGGHLSAYCNAEYASSLAQFGQPLRLERSGGWYLKREIEGAHAFDGIGCYPHLFCDDWRALFADIDALGEDLVSFSAVPDPFGSYELDDLRRAFPDRLIHFKQHYVADLRLPRDQFVLPRHRKRAEAALATIEVEFHEQPLACLDIWSELFDETVDRFDIRGIQAYSRGSFLQQFGLPGVHMSLARHDRKIVAAHLQFIHGDVAYAHLAASTSAARSLDADSALYYSELAYFADKVRWLNWGGAAGSDPDHMTGLDRFKRGWSTETKPVYFGGKVLNSKRYTELCAASSINGHNYFPAYRSGEFR